MIRLLCLLVLAGCATAPPLKLTGLYRFPATAELHHPVLWLSANGTFAFLGSNEEAGTPDLATNSGKYQFSGNKLRLTFQQADCCQFAGTGTEELTVTPAANHNLRVLFRGQTHTLQREPVSQ